METQNVINRLRQAGVILLEAPEGEIRIDLRSQRLTEMMGIQTARGMVDGILNPYCVVSLARSDPSIHEKPTLGVEYGRSPMTRG